jgi:hypothetical protein
MMFFVARDDGSREHYFTETYAEHNAFKEIAAGNRSRLRELALLRADSAARASEAVADKTGADLPVVDPASREVKIGETKTRETKISEVP